MDELRLGALILEYRLAWWVPGGFSVLGPAESHKPSKVPIDGGAGVNSRRR